jgi:hypothetical protein
MNQWYCEIAGREIGPLASQQLRAMAASGQISPSDRVRRGMYGPWLRAQDIGKLFPQDADTGNPKPVVLPASTLPLPPPPPPPTMPPLPSEVAEDVAFDAIPNVNLGTPTGAELASFLRAKRRARQQRTTVALLLAAIGGLAIAGLLLTIGPSRSNQEDKPAATKKARTAQPKAETPEELEAAEGVISLDPTDGKPTRGKGLP